MDIGDLSSIVQLWGYDSLAERERRRAVLQADEAWRAFLPKIQPLIHTQRNRILIPTLVLAASVSGLDGKVAIVTGGSRGIGRAIADGLAAEGARLVIADLEGAEEAAAAYPDGVGLTVDVASEDDAERMAAETVERCGRIDILVNNAGIYASLAMRPFEQIPVEEWRQVMDVNVAEHVPDLPGRGAAHARAGRGQDREHLLGDAVPRRAVPAALRHQQGRDRRAHARAGQGAGLRRGARQLRGARASR